MTRFCSHCGQPLGPNGQHAGGAVAVADAAQGGAAAPAAAAPPQQAPVAPVPQQQAPAPAPPQVPVPQQQASAPEQQAPVPQQQAPGPVPQQADAKPAPAAVDDKAAEPAPDEPKPDEDKRPAPMLDAAPPASPDPAWYADVLGKLGVELAAGELCVLAADKLPPKAGDEAAITQHMRSYIAHFALLEGTGAEPKVLTRSIGAAHPGANTGSALWLHQQSFPCTMLRDTELGPTRGAAVRAADLEWSDKPVVGSTRKPIRSTLVVAGRRTRPGNSESMSVPPQTFRAIKDAATGKDVQFALAYYA